MDTAKNRIHHFPFLLTITALIMKTKALKKQSKKTSAKASKKKITAKKSKSKKQTADKNAEQQEFPGYPHYPANEDVTRNSKRIDADIEDLSLSKTVTPKLKNRVTSKLKRKSADEVVDESLKKSSNDLTKEDYEALGPKDLSLDMGDDEGLKHRASPVDFSGKDMDIPGAELDDDREAVGSEDEENNAYSLGGDNHQDLEEDQS